MPTSELDCITALRACPAFASLKDPDLRTLADVLVGQSLPADAFLFRAGEPASSLFIVVSGALTTFWPWAGEEITLTEHGPGELLGEAEYFEKGDREVSARATVASKVLAMPYDRLPKMFSQLPELYPTFLAQRLGETQRRFRESVARGRLAQRSLQQINEFLDLSDPKMLAEGSEGLIRRIVHLAAQVMKADRASLFLIDPRSGELWSKVALGLGEGDGRITIQPGQGIAGHVLQSGETINLADAYADPRFSPETDRRLGYRTKSLLCGPVISSKERLVGVIQVINKNAGTFDENDLVLFRALSHQVSVAVENFHLFNELRQSNERMSVMLDVLGAVTSTRNVTSLIGRVIERTITAMACERASFFVLDPMKDELWSLKAVGESLEEIRFPSKLGIAGHCATHAEVVNVPDAYDDVRFNPSVDSRTGFRTRNLLAVPVRDRAGSVVGVVEAINRVAGAFTHEDELLLQAIGSQIGEALQKASLIDELQSANQRLLSVNLDLEKRVEERTKDLSHTNELLLESNEELKELMERKSEMMSIIVHDLRNPMANVMQLCELLTEANADDAGEHAIAPAQQREFIGMIRQCSAGLLATLEDMMNSASLDQGEVELKFSQLDAAEIVRAVIALNQANAARKCIHLSLTVEDEPLMIRADSHRLREMLDNLISNAIKYSPEDSRVWISLKPQMGSQPQIRFAIADEGPGIPAEELPKLFGKFQKLSPRPTAGESSSGLGLYIVKRLAELHGGGIEVTSIVGHGSTFFLTLPATGAAPSTS